MLLLAENTANRFTLAAKTGEGPAQLFNDYTTALQTLSAYLSNGSRTLLAATPKSQHRVPFGRGYGRLLQPSPIDLQYAVDQVKFLLTPSLQNEVMAENEGLPAIDLSNDELSAANFDRVNFGWCLGTCSRSIFGVRHLRIRSGVAGRTCRGLTCSARIFATPTSAEAT